LAATRSARNGDAVQQILAALGDAATSYRSNTGAESEGADAMISTARKPLMPIIIDAVRARASVGEISDALESVWKRHAPE
jgi:methylmalonyl-CoA mutase N-terminal domain/subunit